MKHRNWKAGGLAIMLCLLSLLIWCSPVIASEGGPASGFSISGELADVPIGGHEFIMAADPTEYRIAGAVEEDDEVVMIMAAVTFTVEQDHYDTRYQPTKELSAEEDDEMTLQIAKDAPRIVPRC
jgi:hypothetical protein